MTVAEALRRATLQLRQAGIEEAAGDARHLLAHAMHVPREQLLLNAGLLLSKAQQSEFERSISARISRKPVSQITGRRLFWGRPFTVTQDTLDPRPEPECLIEAALHRNFTRILDLGTGTGCILLTLLSERAGATGVGVDISAAAMCVARENAAAFGLADRAEFAVSDWFGGVWGRFDLIVSNPPYIAQAEMPDLAPEVRDWEPHLALTPGGDGLGAYRVIAAGLSQHLADGGQAILEIGAAQGAAVREIFQRAGFDRIGVLADFDGRDRVVLVE